MSPARPDERDFRARVALNGNAAPAAGTVRVDATGTDCGAALAAPLRVDHDEVAAIERADLTVTMRLFDGTTVAFDQGGSLDDLWQVLRTSFRARVSKSLRFAPADQRHTFDARVAIDGTEDIAARSAQVSIVRLGMNFLADSGPCAQLPFGAFGEAVFDPGTYDVALTVAPGPAAPAGAKLTISKLAGRTEEFLGLLRQARNVSLADTARCLATLVPELGAGQRMALAAELAVGRMISLESCEALAPGAWKILWDASAGADRAAYGDALAGLATSPGSLLLGMRPYGGVPRAGVGPVPAGAEVTDQGTAAPRGPAVAESHSAANASFEEGREPAPDSSLPVLYAAALLRGPAAGQDTMALEVLSERDHATYVYRVAPAPAGLDRGAAGAWLASVASHTLLSLDFKKEPLYLPEPELLRAREGLYRAALRRLPGLRELRSRLLGRALHTTPAAWQEQLARLR